MNKIQDRIAAKAHSLICQKMEGENKWTKLYATFLTSWFTDIQESPNDKERFQLDALLGDIFPIRLVRAINKSFPDFTERSKSVYELIQLTLLKTMLHIVFVLHPSSTESIQFQHIWKTRVDPMNNFPLVDLKFILPMNSADFPVIDGVGLSHAPLDFNSQRQKFQFFNDLYRFMCWVKAGKLEDEAPHFPFEKNAPVIGIDCHNMKRDEVITCAKLTNRPHGIVEHLLSMDLKSTVNFTRMLYLTNVHSGKVAKNADSILFITPYKWHAMLQCFDSNQMGKVFDSLYALTFQNVPALKSPESSQNDEESTQNEDISGWLKNGTPEILSNALESLTAQESAEVQASIAELMSPVNKFLKDMRERAVESAVKAVKAKRQKSSPSTKGVAKKLKFLGTFHFFLSIFDFPLFLALKIVSFH